MRLTIFVDRLFFFFVCLKQKKKSESFFSPSLWFKKERKKKVSYFFQLLLTSFPGWKNPIRVTVVSCVQFLFNQSFSCNFAKARILFFFSFLRRKKSRILQPTRESQRKILFFLNYKKKSFSAVLMGSPVSLCFFWIFVASRKGVASAQRSGFSSSLFFAFFFFFFFFLRAHKSYYYFF